MYQLIKSENNNELESNFTNLFAHKISRNNNIGNILKYNVTSGWSNKMCNKISERA